MIAFNREIFKNRELPDLVPFDLKDQRFEFRIISKKLISEVLRWSSDCLDYHNPFSIDIFNVHSPPFFVPNQHVYFKQNFNNP